MYSPCVNCEYKKEHFENCYNNCVFAFTVKSLREAMEDQNEQINSLQDRIEKNKYVGKAIFEAAKLIK